MRLLSASVGLALIALVGLEGCGAPAASPSPPKTRSDESAPRAEGAVPLHLFGAFAEDEPTQLLPLRGAPLLRIGRRMYRLSAHQAHREPALEKMLFDAEGKPWWHTLTGSWPGTLWADRAVPRANADSPPRVEIVRVTEAGISAVGALETQYPTVVSLVPLPDGRVLVGLTTPIGGMDGGEVYESEILPRGTGNDAGVDPKTLRAFALLRRDGSAVAATGRRQGEPQGLATWRPGATVPTVTPTVGYPDGWPRMFEGRDGGLYVEDASSDSILQLIDRTWQPVDLAGEGPAGEAKRLALESASPSGPVPVAVTVEGRALLARVGQLAEDAEGGLWGLELSGLGLFHDQAPAELIALGPKPPRAAMASPLPPPAAAKRPDPGARLVEVLDVSRQEEGDGDRLRMHPLAGRTFISVDDRLLYVDGDTLKSDPALQRGLENRPRYSEHVLDVIGAIGGHFPEAAWVRVNYRAERSQFNRLLRWQGDGWSEALAWDGSAVTTGILPLAGGWSLTTDLPGFPSEEHPDLTLTLLHRNVASNVDAGLLGFDRSRGGVKDATSLADGTLFVATTAGMAAWDPTGKSLPVAPLPAGHAPFQLVALSNRDVFVMTDGPPDAPSDPGRRIVHFDGRSWSEEAPPGKAGPRMERLHVGPLGALWVTLEESNVVLSRSATGAWSTFTAPAHLSAVWVGPAGDVWAVAGDKLLHTSPLPAGFDLVAVLPPRDFQQHGVPCPTVSVLVHEVPRTAPSTVSFDDTISMLAPSLGPFAGEAAYFEVRGGGRRYFAVHLEAPGEDAAERARALAKLAAAKLPGANPRLVCLGSLADHRLPTGATGMRAVGGTADPKAVFE